MNTVSCVRCGDERPPCSFLFVPLAPEWDQEVAYHCAECTDAVGAPKPKQPNPPTISGLCSERVDESAHVSMGLAG